MAADESDRVNGTSRFREPSAGAAPSARRTHEGLADVDVVRRIGTWRAEAIVARASDDRQGSTIICTRNLMSDTR
jgi:hypothetical protein